MEAKQQNKLNMNEEQISKVVEALKGAPEKLVKEAARRRLINFAKYLTPGMDLQPFHLVYYTLLDKFAHGKIRKMIVQAPPQHGKLLADDTLVPTPRGFRRHGDLKVGDYVFGRDGNPVKVLWVSPKDKCGYVVKFYNGEEVQCHGAHEWVVFDRNSNKDRIMEARKLARVHLHTKRVGVGGRYNFLVDGLPVIHYKCQPVKVDPYTLGVWLTQGSSYTGLLDMNKVAPEVLERCPYSFRAESGGYYSQELEVFLRVSSLLFNKHIPDEYKYNSFEVRLQLIAGMLDGCGYVHPKSHVAIIKSRNRCICEDFMEVVTSMGMAPNIVEVMPRKNTKKHRAENWFHVQFTPAYDIPTTRDKVRPNGFKKSYRRPIVSVERREGLGYGNCIEVEGGVYLITRQYIPTHNSEGSSRRLPAFMLGLNPDLRICIGSYATTIARDFNRDVQRIIDTPQYHELFPGTSLNRSNVVTVSSTYLRNSEVIEVVGHTGGLRVVGRGGSLTSKTVDVSILDDVYKDYAEGNSPIVRNAAWRWYTTVVRTRLHNNSQELIVFTRWHEDDLIGRLEKSGEQIIDVKSWEDVENIPDGAWVRINFEGIKTGEPTEIDRRKPGEALWEARHSKTKLEGQRDLDPVQFQCLYQGNPGNAEGRLYQHPFRTWVDKSEWGTYIRSGNYTDVADEGDDFLASVCYDVYRSSNEVFNEKTRRFEPLLYILVTDMEMTQDNIDVTGVTIPAMINRNGTQKAWIESNNGGAGFEKIISKKVRAITYPFYQGGNKESRIITNSATVNAQVIMPIGWETRYKSIYDHLTTFLRDFPANANDDIEDVLTGIVEKEIADGNLSPYSQATRGVRVRN